MKLLNSTVHQSFITSAAAVHSSISRDAENRPSAHISTGASSSRKRSLPSSRDVGSRGFIVAAAAAATVGVALSVTMAAGFQNGMPIRPTTLLHPYHQTGLRVVTDPTSLAPTTTSIETRKSRIQRKQPREKATTNKRVVVDRATLEDLYVLHSALEELDEERRHDSIFLPDDALSPSRRNNKPQRQESTSLKSETKPSNRSSAKSTSKSVKPLGRARMKRSLLSSSPRPLTTTSISKPNTEQHFVQQQRRSGTTADGADPKFRGLTVSPKRKNRKRKSLTKVSPTNRNLYLHPIPDDALGTNPTEMLRLMEEEQDDSLLDVTATEVLDDDGEATFLSSSLDAMYLGGTNVNNVPISERSSTMPGYGQNAMSNRQKAHSDGVKLLEERSGRKLIESTEAKSKRKDLNGAAMYKTSASVPESLMRFAYEIHDVERITAKEEKELGTKTQEAIKIQAVYDGLRKKLAREPTDEEWCAAAGKINMEAISQVIEEGLEAKNRLVISNLRMVQGVVNVYIRNGLQGNYNSGDLMQEGIMVCVGLRIINYAKLNGLCPIYRAFFLTFLLYSLLPLPHLSQALIRAAEKFDPSRGFRFSTYAMYWIRSAIKRDQVYQSRVVQVPLRYHENYKRLIRIQSELKTTLQRAPTKEELVDATGYASHEIDRILEAMKQQNLSFDQNLVNNVTPSKDDGSKDTLYSIIASKVDEGEYNNALHRHLRDDLINTLHQHLTEEEALVLMLRFGLVDNESPNRLSNKTGLRTFAEVSRMAGLKPDKVRRIIQQSLQHLQSVMGDEWHDYQLELQQ
jgi:RNA polymerase sigma factor (sigma-70 family)